MSISLSHKRLTSLVLVAFLCNLLLPYFATYQLPASRPAPLAGLVAPASTLTASDNKILLCTASGFRWVSLVELDSFAGSVDSDLYDCPLCYLSAHGLKTLAVSDNFFLSRRAQPAKLIDTPYIIPTTEILSRGILTRGPPLPA